MRCVHILYVAGNSIQPLRCVPSSCSLVSTCIVWLRSFGVAVVAWQFWDVKIHNQFISGASTQPFHINSRFQHYSASLCFVAWPACVSSSWSSGQTALGVVHLGLALGAAGSVSLGSAARLHLCSQLTRENIQLLPGVCTSMCKS